MAIRTALLATVTAVVFQAGGATAADLPAGFVRRHVTSALGSPTVIQFAPDGRLFVSEQDGTIRVIAHDVLLSEPLMKVPGVAHEGERGLMGLAFDPAFAANGYIYVYYTADEPYLHNRVSRFTVHGNTADPASEFRLMDLDDMTGAWISWHVGGALLFGPDGKLYILTGDNTEDEKSQSLESTFGKVLRINSDGTIPEDNPFYFETDGIHRATWALGLRNPFSGTFHPSGRLFVNDVGDGTWEEVNEIFPGRNFGWPYLEGPGDDPRFANPLYAYRHNDADCAIVGSAFYAPATVTFPASYEGRYFFADFCSGWVRTLDVDSGSVEPFASSLGFITDLKVSPSGSLYYTERYNDRGGAGIFRIEWSAGRPAVTIGPSDVVVLVGETAYFRCVVSGDGPLEIQWQRNQVDLPDEVGEELAIGDVQPGDDGSAFRCRVSNPFGSETSGEALLTVGSNRRPEPVIAAPVDGSLFRPGDILEYRGFAVDPDEGLLDPAALTWQIDLAHGSGADAHLHSLIPATNGSASGTFAAFAGGHSSRDIHLQFRLTAIDSAGATNTAIARVYLAPVDVPAVLEAEDAASATGRPEPNGRWLMSPGDYLQDAFSFPQSGAYQFSIAAAGLQVADQWPSLRLRIDGEPAGLVLVNSSQVGPFVIIAAVEAGTHVVTLDLVNDDDGVTDRRVFLDRLSVAAHADGPVDPGNGDSGGIPGPPPGGPTPPEPPQLLQGPASQAVAVRGAATFTVLASGAEGLSYQWLRNDVPIPGATASTYTVSSAALADNGARFRVRVWNAFGEVISDAAVLTVRTALKHARARSARSVLTGRAARPRR